MKNKMAMEKKAVSVHRYMGRHVAAQAVQKANIAGAVDLSLKSPRAVNPLDGVHLSKSERRGKSYDELQTMRKAKWEAENVEGK